MTTPRTPASLKPGDVVVRVRGEELPRALTVDAVSQLDTATGTVTVHYARVAGSVIEYQHYLEPDAEVVVRERGPRGPRRVVRYGAALVMLAPGDYQTPDGLYKIELVRDEELCGERAHPVRITAADRQRAARGRARAEDEHPTADYPDPASRRRWIRQSAARYAGLSPELFDLVCSGAQGYLCEGERYHERDGWRLWDTAADTNFPATDPHPCPSMRDAVGYLLSLRPQYRDPGR